MSISVVVSGSRLVGLEHHAALRKAELRDLICQRGDGEVGLLPEASDEVADLDFCQCAVVGVEAVSGSERVVSLGGAEVVDRRRLERDITLHHAEAGNARRRIGLGRGLGIAIGDILRAQSERRRRLTRRRRPDL